VDKIFRINIPTGLAWYCSNCNFAHNDLYVDVDDKKYCPQCVPSEVKEKAIGINQNRESIE